MRVVIAEDHFLLREGLTRLLSAYGHQVAAAADNGDDLLSAVREHQPDVAVVDVRLPPGFTDEGLRAALAARAERARSRSWCCPSTSSSCTPASSSPTAPEPSATCSRTAS